MRRATFRKWAAAVMAAAASTFAGSASAAKEDTVHLITVDPGHFHAALVQKFMLPGVDPAVQVFAPASDDLDQHLKRVESFNSRAENPTHWTEKVYADDDYLRQALQAIGGNKSDTASA